MCRQRAIVVVSQAHPVVPSANHSRERATAQTMGNNMQPAAGIQKPVTEFFACFFCGFAPLRE